MKRTVRVLICRLGAEPEDAVIEDTLETYQGIVGGYVERVPLNSEINIWCNENAMLEGLALNCTFPARAPALPQGFDGFVINLSEDLAKPGEMGEWRILGNFFLAKEDDETGEILSFDDEEIKFLTAMVETLRKRT